MKPIVIYIEKPRPAIVDPCARGYHRWAWLVSGRQACGYCGRPR